MPSRSSGDDIRRLRHSVDWALRRDLDPSELVPMLRKLAEAASPDSEDYRFAHRHLAEMRVESEPWQAALSARTVLASTPDDDWAWAVLALSYTLLGHYRAAVSAYRRALALAPTNPWYAHNLGHLLDVTCGRPAEAIPLLTKALRKEPREAEIAASLAHALGGVGRIEEARTLLRSYMKRGGTAEQRALMTWLDEREAMLSAGVASSKKKGVRGRRGSSARKLVPKDAPPS